ncbi:hypothetical protein HXX76_005410 [Chlamydomonas incerta]|uniref:Uncharacterized protein n=1 Tax=Chlamydomonas incerta TaxID=51695 RepID=A0A835TFH5_CHLIN|nr:hypothetical protein HXX76_005410 [Chlamydomonas incerta]|eukprot:KAG2437790.1 hypothetical protein HXX76_005410 [Chlamydomonas incerta]
MGELVKSIDMRPMIAAPRAAGALPLSIMRWWCITRVWEEAVPEGSLLHFGHKPVECVDVDAPKMGARFDRTFSWWGSAAEAQLAAAGADCEEGGDDVALWYMEARADAMAAEGVDASPEGPILRHAAEDGGAVAPPLSLRMAAHLPPDASWTNGRGMVLVHTSGRPDGQGGNLAFAYAVELAAHVRQHGLGQQDLPSE